MREFIPADDLCGAAVQQGADDRMLVRVEACDDFGQRTLEQIANGNALADVQVAKRVYVYALRMPQVLPGARRELLPGCRLHPRCEQFSRTAPEEYGRLARW